MKKIFTIAILALYVSAFAQMPMSGLIGYYPFNGNAVDETGNGYDGSVNGAILIADRFGNSNSAYFFNGASDIILQNTANVTFTNGITFTCWIKPTILKMASIVDKMPNCPTATEGLRINIRDDGEIHAGAGCYGAGSGAIATNAYIVDNWYMVTGTWNSDGTLQIYINGVFVNSVIRTYNMINSDNIEIGQGNLSANYEQFEGTIDDICIYDRVLNSGEIWQIYTGCALNASISANGSTTFCSGNSIVLSSIHQGSPFTFQWLLNNTPIASETSYNYTATTSGSYSVIVDSLGCIDTSNVISVTVNPLPTVSINAIPAFTNYFATPLILSGNPSGGTFSGSGITGNNFNPNTAGLGSHSILYNYTDVNSCSSSASASTIVYDTLGVVCTSYDTITTYISVTDTLIIDAVLTGIAPPNNINTLKIYPNPASTHITIDNGDYLSMTGYTIRIDNNLSQTVFTTLVNQASFYVDLSSWTGNGLYFVYIIDNLGNTIEIKKIVLQ